MEADDLASTVQEGVLAAALGHQLVIERGELILELQPHRRDGLHSDIDQNLFGEDSGDVVAAVDVQHRRGETHGLQAVEVPAQRVQEEYPGLLHPPDVVGVVDDAHLVRLIVLDGVRIRRADKVGLKDQGFGFGRFAHRTFPQSEFDGWLQYTPLEDGCKGGCKGISAEM